MLRISQIPVVADLPVGNNLQDHIMISQQVDVDQAISITPAGLGSVWSELQYKLFGTGRFKICIHY
jgi:hypothetical protein